MISDLWYKNAIIYSLSLDSFLDANGDGVGDFQGAIRRLDYLQGLGITAIWLMPFHPSPGRDHGYDISDYYGVDPRYGTLGDFVEFAHACRQRGIRVHDGPRHQPHLRPASLVQGSLRRPELAYPRLLHLVRQETGRRRPRRRVSRRAEDDMEPQPKAKAWYFHRFMDFQPDLNIANPDVRAEMLKIVGFWLELGVSGFRMDAVPFLIAEDGINTKNPKLAFGLLREIRAFAQWRKGDAVLLAEANMPPAHALEYVGADGDRLHMMFNFPANQALFYALASADGRPLRKILEESRGLPKQGNGRISCATTTSSISAG